MPATDEPDQPDEPRLAGRMPRRQVDDAVAAAAGRWREQGEEPGTAEASEPDGGIDDTDLDAVTRLMGFLRGDDGD